MEVRIPDRVLHALTFSYTRPEEDLYAAIVAWCAAHHCAIPLVTIRYGRGATVAFDDPNLALMFKLRWC